MKRSRTFGKRREKGVEHQLDARMAKRAGTLLRTQLKHLKARIAELEATLKAIHSGEVDAIVVNGPQGSRIFTLQGPDDPYRLLVERMNEGAATLNSEGTMLFCNRKLAEMLRHPAQKIVGSLFASLVTEAQRQRFEALRHSCRKHDAKGEFDLLQCGGTSLPVQLGLSCVPMVDRGRGICLVVTDLSEQKQVENGIRSRAVELEQKVVRQKEQLNDASEGLAASQAQLTQAEEKYKEIVQNAVIGIFQSTPDGRFVSANPAMARMLGYDSPEQLMTEVSNIGRQVFCDPSKMREYELLLRQNGVAENAEAEVVCKTGNKKWMLANVRLARRADGIPIYEGMVEDITERKAAEGQVVTLAYYDSLTGLPNRTLLNDRLSTALANARRRSEAVAVMFIDIDRFKTINDSLGHSVGDLLLKDVATRLRGITRDQDTLARLGGDEFVLLLTGIKGAAEVAVTAERLLTSIREEMIINNHSFGVTCSLGISIFPDHGVDGETLLKNADAAMYRAKENGRNGFQLFTQDMHARAVERLAIQSDLRSAIKKKELFLAYQPQVDLTTGEIEGAEALLRWRHMKLGLIPPNAFVPIAENTGLIIPLGDWVLRTACTQARRWLDEGYSMRVAVNVSAFQLRRDGFVAWIKDAVSAAGLSPEWLELEITESVLLSDIDATLLKLHELRNMGMSVSIDDFGTGYSSLSYLRRLPVSKLKIDRSFVQGMVSNPDDAIIARMIIQMARNLKLISIAEGVETEEQLRLLKEQGCDQAQGFYYGEPVEASRLTEILPAAAAQPAISTPPMYRVHRKRSS